jgi:hypothetical protein
MAVIVVLIVVVVVILHFGLRPAICSFFEGHLMQSGICVLLNFLQYHLFYPLVYLLERLNIVFEHVLRSHFL